LEQKEQLVNKLINKYNLLLAISFPWLPKIKENKERKLYSQTLKENAISSHP